MEQILRYCKDMGIDVKVNSNPSPELVKRIKEKIENDRILFLKIRRCS